MESVETARPSPSWLPILTILNIALLFLLVGSLLLPLGSTEIGKPKR